MNETVTVPGYRIVRPLGVGGMASVYLAVQESLDREVALKVMAPALAANQEFTERFVKEGRITAKLSHPNLVTIFDIGSYGSTFYFAAEYIPGGTLRERLQNGLSLAEALDVLRDVAMGLHYAHDKGFVHRDVKPGNILFRSDGSAVLADFGIAKSIHSKTVATQAGSSIGTPHYMSPEQARAEAVDGRSDLYALGAVLFELITGDAPYLADDPFTIALMHVTHPVPVLPAPHQWLQPLIDGLMAKDPKDRFPNGEAYMAACDRLLATAPQAAALREGANASRKRPPPRLAASGTARSAPAVPAARDGGAAPRHGLNPLLLGGAGIAAVLLVLVLWMLLRPRTPEVAAAAPEPAATATESPARAATGPEPATDPSNDPGTPGLGNDIAGLLQRAGDYVKTGFMENGRRLTSPEGDSAVDLYQHVLGLQPDNAQARAGLQQIADYYEQKAKAAYDRGIYAGSQVLAEEGLKAAPDSPGLQKLLDESKRATGQ